MSAIIPGRNPGASNWLVRYVLFADHRGHDITQSSVVLVGRPQPQQMIGRLAEAQDHEVVSIRSSRSLEERLGGLSRDWVLLLLVDAGGNEAPMLSATLQALGRATVTYIVMRFQPRAVTELFEKGYQLIQEGWDSVGGVCPFR